MDPIVGEGSEFSSNGFTSPQVSETEVGTALRHSDMCFEDGNIVILAGQIYFLLHQGVICRHSQILQQAISGIQTSSNMKSIEGRPVLSLPYAAQDLSYFWRALYGLPVSPNGEDAYVMEFALLKLSTVYEVTYLRAQVLNRLTITWPITLAQWEIRELVPSVGYPPPPGRPHPILVVALSREVDAPELLPSAFYDLSRYLPSQLASDHLDLRSNVVHRLSLDDLYKVFRGKEQAARYLSTFVVNELEGRMPSKYCQNRHELHPFRKRGCQAAFEAVTLSVLRDCNGMMLGHGNSDPLYTLADSLIMQTKDDTPGIENAATHRACEACRLEYGSVVKAVREEFWRRIPEWFELDVENWG